METLFSFPQLNIVYFSLLSGSPNRAQIGVIVLGAAAILLVIFFFLWNKKRKGIKTKDVADKERRQNSFLSALDHRLYNISRKLDLTPALKEALILATFLLVAVLYTLGRWKGITPFIFLGGDASRISTFPGVLSHPELFMNDYLLNTTRDAQWYVALHVPLIGFLGKLLNGYGNAFLALLPPTIFLKLYGFYYLGKFLFKNKGMAFLLACATFPVIYVGVWDYWGLISDVLPRNLFEIAFPFIIVLTIKLVDQPKKWFWMGILLGGLVYIHSISSIVIFCATMLVFLLASNAPIKKRVAFIGFTGFIFLFMSSYFIFAYQGVEKPTNSLTYETGISLYYKFYGNHLDIPSIALAFISEMIRLGIIPAAILGVFCSYYLNKKKLDLSIKIVLLFILSITITALLIPFLEYSILSHFKILPLEIFLARGIRYLPPLLFTLFLFAFPYINRFFEGKRFYTLAKISTAFLYCFLTFSMMFNISVQHWQGEYLRKEVSCLFSGHLFCPSQEEVDGLALVEAIDDYVKPGETMLTVPPGEVEFEQAIRYQAERPMGFSDLTRLSADLQYMDYLNNLMIPWNEIATHPENDRLQEYINLAPDVHADYLVIQKSDFTRDSLEQVNPLYENSSYILIKVK